MFNFKWSNERKYGIDTRVSGEIQYVRKKYKMNIIGIVHGEDVQIMPSADYRFSSDEHIKVISDNDSVDAYLKHVK